MHRWFVIGSVAACSSPEIPADAPTEGRRVDLPIIEFDEWTDFLALQGSLTEDCVFMDPLLEDDSTVWPPLQVFWVIYDKESDVKDGDLVQDTFFVGDSIAAGDFANKAGKSALGFKFLTALQRSFLDIEQIDRRDGGRVVEALLGSPIDAWIRLDATGEDCAIETTYCEEPCNDDFLPFSSIYMELGAFLSVQDIQYR